MNIMPEVSPVVHRKIRGSLDAIYLSVIEMKQWYAVTCPVCGFRFSPKKFNAEMKSILYPLQLVTGGGRARGFRVVKYLPWSILPTLRQTQIWNNILVLYGRLASAYDNFYQTLGFLSPDVQSLLRGLNQYADVYGTNPTSDYAKIYATPTSTDEIPAAYSGDEYSKVYAYLYDACALGDA
jgi:hypothetical protein